MFNTIHRYGILGFRLFEKVPPTRDNCRHLLVKLKLDGWAIGKTKVFLKYYHVEHLTKLHEKQVNSLFLCIRISVVLNYIYFFSFSYDR